MSPPKDTVKLQEYKEKMRKIALEKWYWKWMKWKDSPMKWKKHSKETKNKLSKIFKIISKEKWYWKWMEWKKMTEESKEKQRAHRLWKTYKEIYWSKAEEESLKRKMGNRKHWE